jgi:sporulation protein YlmC with PRC-barrel domain
MKLSTVASVAALTIALGLAPQAMAQTQSAPIPPAAERTAPPKTPVEGQILVQDAKTILASNFIGRSVYAPDKTKIGTIADLILTSDGTKVEGLVIGVGGFLGLGEKNVALKIERLKMSDIDGRTQLAMDVKKEELANAPTFKTKEEVDADKRAEQVRNAPPAGPISPKTN